MNKEKEHNCNCNHDHEGHHNGDCGCHDHDGDCCNHDHDHLHDTITLTLDNDEVVECIVLGVFDVKDREYIALLPDDEDNVLLYRYASDNDEDVELTNIEDDDEFELVSNTFRSMIEEEDDEEDDQ